MRRFFTYLLAASMLLTLTACSGNVDHYSVTLAAADFEYIESTIAPPSEITFEKLTVCESDNYNIIIRNIKPDSPEGYILSVDLSNNAESTVTTRTEYVYATDDDGEKYIIGEETVTVSTGVSYLFVVESAAVNGKKIDVSFSAELSADDRTFDQIVLDNAALEGLGTITKIELPFEVYIIGEEEHLNSKISAVIYPYGYLAAEE